jgi:tRNA U34 2-thiouridine synthase MnmA/TrmU
MKAISLISGGLDSILAAKIIQSQRIEVIPLNFKIPFSQAAKKISSQNQNKIKEVAANLGIELKTVDITKEFLELLESPRYGFGSNMNPCIDCKIFMLTKARELLGPWGAEFIITGEVLGQRPMSQNRQSLELIEKRAGLEGLLLRPLSAKLLPETIPEQRSWVQRDKLLGFSGRSRRPQMELARELGIKEYPNPAGGCLLTDPEFAKRLKELIAHQELSLENIELLKIGRHFRISPRAKLMVGRNEKENEELLKLAEENDYLFMPTEKIAGPTSLARGEFNEESLKLCCSITCRYCDLDGETETEIIYRKIPGKEDNILKAAVIEEGRLVSLRI